MLNRIARLSVSKPLHLVVGVPSSSHVPYCHIFTLLYCLENSKYNQEARANIVLFCFGFLVCFGIFRPTREFFTHMETSPL